MSKNLESILDELSDYLKDNRPKYLYNTNFTPGKDQILYSGPYWDEKEIVSSIKSLLSGKWLVTDENPYHRAKVDVYFYKRKELAFVKVDSAEVIMPVKDTVTLYVTKAPELPVNKQFQPLLIYSSLPQWIKKFNFNHWIERTDFWYVYELQSK